MRILALIFSAIGIYELLQLVNVEVYHFLPVRSHSFEDGLIVASMALIFGSAASVISLLFASAQFRRDKNRRSSQLLLVWCSLVPAGFIIVFLYTYAAAVSVETVH
ncbi:MAG TPA: hypothetical protein VG347_15715 [Verrucomicrobiae bacterium]|nr:hypothetical protein [Verrucomicrobiae bacterium]